MFSLSIKQLMRTPLKSLLFILLLASATMLLVFGSVLLVQTDAHIEQVENTFTTIGMVDQLPSSTQTVIYEDSCGNLGTVSYDVYDELLTLDALEFEGADYLTPPENRVCYIGTPYLYNTASPDDKPRSISAFVSQWGGMRSDSTIVAEIIPLSDSRDGQPVQAEVGKVLFGALASGQEISFCPHHSTGAISLQKGKKYMACMKAETCKKHNTTEYVPVSIPYSSKYDASGVPIGGGIIPAFHLFRQGEGGTWVTNHEEGGSVADLANMQFQLQDEDDENFSMESWEKWAELLREAFYYYPTIAANNLELLPSFHSGNAQIMTGRAITQEEFDSGAKVCLIPDEWNQNSRFVTGASMLTLPLSITLRDYPVSKFNSVNSNSFFQPYSYFDTNGKQYAAFSVGDYEVVGTYYVKDKRFFGTNEVELAANTIIIPAKSVSNPNSNVVYQGPLSSSNVSFQIPNGTIASFDKKLRDAVPEAEMLTITYDDNGYEDLMPSLERTRITAILLCAVGAAGAVAVVIFLLYFFIARECRRTAIERGLGMSKGQCCVSLISGLLVLALIGTVLGSGLGLLMISSAQPETEDDEEGMYAMYSTQYSDWTNKWTRAAELPEAVEEQAPLVPLSCAIPAALLVLIFALSMVMVSFNLRMEPIELLGGKQ